MFPENTYIYILPNGMGSNRVQLFKNALLKHNSHVIDENKILNVKNGNFIILVDETSFDNPFKVEKAICKKKFYSKELFETFKIIKSAWLSDCLKNKSCMETTSYELIKTNNQVKSEDENEKINHETSTSNLASTSSNCNKNDNYASNNLNRLDIDSSDSAFVSNKKRVCESNDEDFEYLIRNRKKQKSSSTNNNNDESSSDSDSSISYKSAHSSFDSTDETDAADDYSNKNLVKRKPAASYICTHSSKEQNVNYNKDVTDKLEELGSIYTNTKDKYRALGYQKAIAALKRYPKRITTWEEAKSLYGVGKRLADKIWEIVQTGELRKLEEMNSREDLSAISLFTKMHGVGPTTAQSFVSQGFRTLDDLKTKANLNKHQKIGLKYYDEFLVRIPRDEVAEIEKVVVGAALSLNSNLIIKTCGSYRRKKATCGDVDILITAADGHSHKGIFNKLIELLHEKNFLTDDLVSQEEVGNQKKYLGVCILPGENRLHRRLDIIVVPYDEFACALLYFTGSAHFNRSMRLLARKNGMSLSEHALCKNVLRKGTEKLNIGEKIHTPTEESIFKCLNLTYRPPEERDF